MSLWRIDEYGVAKTKYAYFTPNNNKYHKVEKLIVNFAQSFDSGKFVVTMVKIKGGDTNMLVFDANTCELLEEHEVKRIIKNGFFTMPYDNFHTDFQVDNPTSYYATLSHLPRVYSWNNAE